MNMYLKKSVLSIQNALDKIAKITKKTGKKVPQTRNQLYTFWGREGNKATLCYGYAINQEITNLVRKICELITELMVKEPL